MTFRYKDIIPDIYNGDSNNRFLLGKSGKRMIVVIGINPSNANMAVSDRSVNCIIIPVAQSHNYDGWLVINPYTQVTSTTDVLDIAANQKSHSKNMEVILEHVLKMDKFDVWCAWGNYVLDDLLFSSNLKSIVDILRPKVNRWLTTAINQRGTPKHPRRATANDILIDYDISTL